MQSAVRILVWIVRISGLVQIVLGVLFWTGRAGNLLPLHIANGFLIVAALWILAILALIAGARLPLVVVALAWGLALATLGLRQAGILVGSSHWVIRVVHLLMGLGALALTDPLARPILRKSP